jgi:uncharacterized membrane-anchored protein YitT (DUF2179 family)
MTIEVKAIAKNIFFVSLGVLSASFGLKGFLLPSHFLDGGIMGISLLINITTGLDLSLLLVVLNLPFIFIGYKRVSKNFAISTPIAIVLLAAVLALVPFPVVTTDKLLVSFFGGFFLGVGIGLSIRGGCVLDGSEVLAIYTSKKTPLTVGDFILIVNVFIFAAAAYLINKEIALYAVLTFLVATKAIDFVVHGIEEYTALTIVSSKSEEIKEAIVANMGRGITVLKGKSGFGKKGHRYYDVDVIYTVVTRLEIQKLKNEVLKIDENAFVVENSVNDIKGGMIKKRPLQN